MDRRAIDAVVLVVHAVVEEQRVDLVSEVLEKGRVAEKAHVPIDSSTELNGRSHGTDEEHHVLECARSKTARDALSYTVGFVSCGKIWIV